jgi:hypothetical protein
MKSQRKQKQLSNKRFVRCRWGNLSRDVMRALEQLTNDYGLSALLGDVLYLDDKWYVTHAGLLRIARRRRCAGIAVQPMRGFCNAETSCWAFRATVYTRPDSKGFVGFGDANPSNVSSLVRGAEMRVAETRAVNRALRKAYGIGICSVEELGSLSRPMAPASNTNKLPPRPAGGNGNGNGQPRLRDLLCLLIRQNHLDAALVKKYATDFCSVPDLRQASREQIEALIKHLTEFAAKDPAGLTEKLNSFAEKPESAGAA